MGADGFGKMPVRLLQSLAKNTFRFGKVRKGSERFDLVRFGSDFYLDLASFGLIYLYLP